MIEVFSKKAPGMVLVAFCANNVSAIASTYGYTEKQWPFAAFLNDEATPRWTTGTANGVPDNTVYSFDIAPGELTPGWNTIKVKDIGQGVYWCCLHPPPRRNLRPVPITRSLLNERKAS